MFYCCCSLYLIISNIKPLIRTVWPWKSVYIAVFMTTFIECICSKKPTIYPLLYNNCDAFIFETRQNISNYANGFCLLITSNLKIKRMRCILTVLKSGIN